MTSANDLMRRLSMRHPIIQAPMAGGIDTPRLVAAVGEAGGFGFVGAAYLSPEHVQAAATEIRTLTDRPFGINLFPPTEVPSLPGDVLTALDAVAPAYAAFGLPEPTVPDSPVDAFDARLDAALDSGASALGFTLGPPTEFAIEEAKRRGMMLVGTATTVEEGRQLQTLGVDAVVAQGAEAGGHRGTFARHVSVSLIGTMALVPQMVDALDVPVIAAGGIMDGRGIAAALALGASAVQMGSAFLATDESGTDEAYRAAVVAARDSDTMVTTAFTGKPARAIMNRFMGDLEREGEAGILPFPYQGGLTGPVRSAALKRRDAEYLFLPAGQGVGMTRSMSAGDLMARLVDETDDAITRLNS